MKRSDSISAIAAALAKAQGAMANARKDKDNPAFRGSKYAPLSSIVDAIKAPLAANGIAYVQTTIPSDKQAVCVETTLIHESGEWIQSEPLEVPVQKADAQGFGSALTYCRRYSLSTILGIAPDDDDDGNAASGARPTAAQQEKEQVRGEPPLTEATVAELMGMLDRAADVGALRDVAREVLARAKAANDPAALARLREHALKANKMLEEAATA